LRRIPHGAAISERTRLGDDRKSERDPVSAVALVDIRGRDCAHAQLLAPSAGHSQKSRRYNPAHRAGYSPSEQLDRPRL